MSEESRIPINAARRYLRRRDKIGAYLPLLTIHPDASETWTYLWTEIRNLDDHSERGSPMKSVTRPLGGRALKRYPNLSTELRELAQLPSVEASLYGRNCNALSLTRRYQYYADNLEQDATRLPEQFLVEQLYGRRWHPAAPPTEVKNDRRLLLFIHYGIGGLLPTLTDLSRILLQL